MFFFIGGMQPKTIDMDNSPMLCPSCGLLRARNKRIDHYLSLFFIPVIRVKKGEPFLYCDKCGIQSGDLYGGSYTDSGPRTCKNCGRIVESAFSYCPFCGKSL